MPQAIALLPCHIQIKLRGEYLSGDWEIADFVGNLLSLGVKWRLWLEVGGNFSAVVLLVVPDAGQGMGGKPAAN